MHMPSISATSLVRSDFTSAAQPQSELGTLRVPSSATNSTEEDRVTLSAPLITDMKDEDVQTLLSSTLDRFSQNAGDALSAHAGLDMSRAMRLLEGLDL